MFRASLLLILCAVAVADDFQEADGLAATGSALLSAGKTEKAKQMFYKALVYDGACATALYELGKLFGAEGDKIHAADFLNKAVIELSKGQTEHKDYAAKRLDAVENLKKLNPLAMDYESLIADYAQQLVWTNKKYPGNAVTSEGVASRVTAMHLAELLPKEKLAGLKALPPPPPKFDPEHVDYAHLTEDQWNKIPVAVFKVLGHEINDPKIDVAPGQKYVVIPNPKDIWNIAMGNADWQRETDFLGRKANGEVRREMMMLFCVGKDGVHTPVTQVIEGTGKLTLFADGSRWERGGMIRVKIIKLK
jgi:tetratricopeptide (TPR) repeat protein